MRKINPPPEKEEEEEVNNYITLNLLKQKRHTILNSL
jgi:hypothetical protein